MEKQANDSDEKLFDYLDGQLTSVEKTQFENVLQNSSVLKKRLEELRSIESTLKSIKREEPSHAFAQNVMNKINHSPQGYSLSIGNGIFLLLGVIAVSLLAAILIQFGLFDGVGSFNAPKELGLLSKYIKEPLPSIPVNGKLIVNGIIFLNLVLGFVLLDRTVFRPYFERRMRHS